MKKYFVILSAVLPLSLASCSQDSDYIAQQNCVEVVETTSVESLVKNLKEYDAQFAQRRFPLHSEPEKKKKKLTWLEWLKVGIADVKGGLTGTSVGGWCGTVIGAAIASAEKYVELMDAKGQKKEKTDINMSTSIVNNASSLTFEDSLGYYHNLTEELLYDKYGNSMKTFPMQRITAYANSCMENVSDGYRSYKHPTRGKLLTLSQQLTRIKNVKDSTSVDFFEYCDNLKALSPADSSYMDFAAEYLYTCVCANVGDIREYTCEVLRQIDSSNATDSDKRKLSQCVIIAYSSLVYSSQIECSDINQ